MTRKYTFTAKDLEIIKEARRKNKDKRAEVRLHVLELRAEGKRAKEIAEIVGVSAPYVSQLAAKYFAGGIEAKALIVPENIRLAFIPPYTPEMNPIEQIWKEIRKRGFRNEGNTA